MKMIACFLFVLLCGGLSISSVFAATLETETDVYQKPDTSSKKLEVVHVGSMVHVTGQQEDDLGTLWFSIDRGKEPHLTQAWINGDTVALEQGDTGYVREIGFRSHLRLFFGAGLGTMASNSEYFAGRLSGGIDYLVGQSRSVIELMLAKPLSDEKYSSGPYQGAIHRIYLLPGYGYYLIPEKLMLRASLGLGYLTGESANIDSKLKPTFGFGVRYLKDLNESYGVGLELAYEYSGTAYKSINDPTGISNNLNCATIPNSSGCQSGEPGTIPQASIWSMNFLFVFH
jgi:hypothetical protein